MDTPASEHARRAIKDNAGVRRREILGTVLVNLPVFVVLGFAIFGVIWGLSA
ncbi:hypothetical protein [Pseudoclavibacter sp. RFBA6]|uniref:hypothetical protein n=1 Tax=Pseudoclavibacter sp. RFBA6 TaxID=2080573 RepID=UPI0015E21595|nr:hypothetical protein [Pseudoclavibacter sp. RFBA6]